MNGAPPEIAVVRTGTANLASVLAALRRAGARTSLTSDPREVLETPFVVLPGVGALASAMRGLADAGLVEPLAARIASERPTLAICLGLQLLGESSEESPGVAGIGVLPFSSVRITGGVRVPHLGWNRVVPDEGCEVLREGHAYFAHGYRVEETPEGWSAARTDYGSPFVAALERGAVLACQFHPELSGSWGLELIGRWIERGGASC